MRDNSVLPFLAEFGSLMIAVILFFGMIAAYWVGTRLTPLRKSAGVSTGINTLETSCLSLLALLLAFTFGVAVSRYDARRQIVVEEANYIDTAILMADLYPEAERALFRVDFKDYVEARISFYEAGNDTRKIVETTRLSTDISTKIWKRTASFAQKPESLIASNQMVPALNGMLGIVTTRNAGNMATVPDPILWVLFGLCLLSSFAVGYSQSEKRESRVIVFILLTTITASVFLILELDRPRTGLITLDRANSNIVALRKMFEDD